MSTYYSIEARVNAAGEEWRGQCGTTDRARADERIKRLRKREEWLGLVRYRMVAIDGDQRTIVDNDTRSTQA